MVCRRFWLEQVGPDARVRAGLAVLPMGWSWSLWVCQNVLREAMVAAETAVTAKEKELEYHGELEPRLSREADSPQYKHEVKY